MGTTNYSNTFIQVAEDCPVQEAQEPPVGGEAPTIAELQHRLIVDHTYEFTSDDVLFAVHAIRQDIPDDARAREREAFFARDQACLRSSPLGKRYGWGVHHNDDGRIALVPLGSDEYLALAADPGVKQLKAMRSKRT
ncbi:DUF6157 family protein [Agromyces bauzanensis]|uniref:Uncharacterized protein n=1 Tax=Agromyces bauzanensis TaxID=1308924 RepID=A0A917P9B7_9MICO|nr:DUF6157 family protein [Agromyces bauzanensis]GGJ67486.1 hypothetical protein GCM10011372_01590 [Agromyces bauzanensis]